MGTIKHIGTARPRQSKTTRLLRGLFGQSKPMRTMRRRAVTRAMARAALWLMDTASTTIAPLLSDLRGGPPPSLRLRSLT